MSIDHVLIIGLSSIVKRRVLPALHTQRVGRIDVATRQAHDPAVRAGWTSGSAYSDYPSALEDSGAQVVYISLVNSEHNRWVEEALGRRIHVIVDKPAFLGLEAAERAVSLADRQGVCLAEANVYPYHPQFDCVRETFKAAGSRPAHISVTFSFPPMEPGNFRYRRDLGGGALWDLGPYAASLGRVFFGDDPVEIESGVASRGRPDGVETGFSMVAVFPGGRSAVGHFGFDTIYRNRIELLSEEIGVEIDRAFTTPPEVQNRLRVTRHDQTSEVLAPAGDAFGEFFAAAFGSIERGDWRELTADLLSDARALQRLRDSAGAA